MEYTVEQLKSIVDEACSAAKVAATKYFNEKLGGNDRYACGFAWVSIYEVKGNTRLGRNLKKVGVKQAYDKSFQIWNPSGHHCQNIDTKEAGAVAAAEVFRKYGFTSYAGGRLD